MRLAQRLGRGNNAPEPQADANAGDAAFTADSREDMASIAQRLHQKILDNLDHFDDPRIGVEHRQAAETFDGGDKPPAFVDGAVDFKAVPTADIVVFLAVAGRGVHQARAGFQRHMVAEDNR